MLHIRACGSRFRQSESCIGHAQAIRSIPDRQGRKVNVVSLPGQPRVQLGLPAARKLAAKAPGGAGVGAPGLGRSGKSCVFAILACMQVIAPIYDGK